MRRQLIPLLFLNFVNALGFAVLIPIFPFLVEEYGGNELAFGILIAAYPIFQFLGAPVLGSISDAYGRRPVLFFSQLGTLISWIVFGVALIMPKTPLFDTTFTLPLVVIGISRIIDGITGGNFSVAAAAIADFVPREQKTKIFGMIGAIVGIGVIVGPFIGGYTTSFSIGYVGVAIFSFILSLITLVSMYMYLPETLTKDKRVTLHLSFSGILKEVNIYEKIVRFNMPLIKKLFFIRAFFAFVFSAYTTTIVLFMKGVLELTTNQIGIQFLILGCFFIINQAFITPYLARLYGNLQTYYIGQLCMLISLFLLAFIENIWIFIPVTFITSIGIAASIPTFKSLITDLVSEQKQGEISGMDESVLAGTSAVAPIFAGGLYTLIQQESYLIFAAILVIPFLYIWYRTGRFTA